MRQIAVMEYSCPHCNADLIVQSVDFAHAAVNGEATKTIFQCIGCLEYFYTVEDAHVTAPEKTPEYKCHFCQNQCIYLSLKDDWTDYWKCVSCKVSYSRSYDPNYTGTDVINMYTNINDKLYVLRQFPKEKKSRVDYLPADPEDTIVIVKDFNFLFPNITPANIETKLRTYITFS